jgi:hypothetical protein
LVKELSAGVEIGHDDRMTELIPSWLGFADLQYVDGFREFPGAP